MIKIRVLRSLWLDGVCVEAGKLLSVSLGAAVDLEDSGRAVLIDPNDRALLQAERKTSRARLVAALPAVPAAHRAESPWISILH